MESRITEIIENIIGDTPVSVQLATALNKMASQEDILVLQAELGTLRKEIEKLTALVGDTPVSEQIYTAIKER